MGRARPRNAALAVAFSALGVASRHRVAVVVATLVSLVAAVAIAVRYSQAQWEGTSTLLYAPLTGPDTQGSLYVPPDLKTLVALAKSPRNLETVRRDFKLPLSLEALEKLFKVTIPTGTKTVEVTFRSGTARGAADMVNRLVDLFREQVAEVRKAKINGYVDDFAEHLEGCRNRLQAANDALAEFDRANRVGDVASDLARLNDEIKDLDTELAHTTRERSSYAAQLTALDAHIASLKDQDRKREDDEKAAEAADETVADNRRRQDRLRELISEERTKMEVGAKLAAARADATRLARLAERGHASRDSLEEVQAQILILEAQIKETDTIRSWKDELERIDKVIVPKGKTKNQGSTAIEQIVFKKLELNLFITAAERGIEGLQADIAKREAEVRRLMGLQQRQRSLAKVVESCDAERLAASAELTALKKLQAIRTFEFAVVDAGLPRPVPGVVEPEAPVPGRRDLRNAGGNREPVVGGLAALASDRLDGRRGKARPAGPGAGSLGVGGVALGRPGGTRVAVDPAPGAADSPGPARVGEPRPAQRPGSERIGRSPARRVAGPLLRPTRRASFDPGPCRRPRGRGAPG